MDDNKRDPARKSVRLPQWRGHYVATAPAGAQLSVRSQSCVSLTDRIRGVVKMERGFENEIVAALAIPDEAILFVGSSAPLHDKRPGPFPPARGMGGVAREEEHLARVNLGHSVLPVRRHVVQV